MRPSTLLFFSLCFFTLIFLEPGSCASEGNLERMSEMLAEKLRTFEERRLSHYHTPWKFLERQSIIEAHELNFNRTLLNGATLGPPDGSHVYMLLLVHKKPHALEHALHALQMVAGIENAILVISHDGIYPEVWDLVRSINFTRVKQLIHPYSPWLKSNRHAFPGDDPIFKSEDSPGVLHGQDTYKHHRDYKFTALKHHWWWAHSVLFHGKVGLPPAEAVIYLEDDWVFTRDFFLAALSLTRWKEKKCPQCLTINMGSHKARGHAQEHMSEHAHSVTLSLPENLGLIIPKSTWSVLIDNNASVFCHWDDYNWDWSLIHAFSLLPGPRASAVAALPRVKHIGHCGLHGGETRDLPVWNESACGFETDHKLFSSRPSSKFAEDPSRSVPAADEWISAGGKAGIKGPKTGNGGWGSREDHEHCVAVASGLLF